MFFRGYPPDYARAWVTLASEFHWTPQVLEELGADELRWWLAELEGLALARARAWRTRRLS